MRDRQNAVLDALQRSQRFLDQNATLLTSVDLTAALKRLDDVVKSFAGHAFDQDVGDRGAKGETAKQLQLRIKLRREQMEPIAFIARRNLRNVPEFKALQMPKLAVKGPAFLVSARGMADAAKIHHDTLVGHGLPATFLNDFEAGITKLETSANDREKSVSRRIGATKGLDLEEKSASTVLTVLNALVQQALSDNESLLRVWQSARQIRRGTANKAVSAATTEPAPASAASTPAGAAAPASPAVTPLPVSESAPAAAA
jgi:hypothetical protein